jgi:hypothetical protein
MGQPDTYAFSNPLLICRMLRFFPGCTQENSDAY